MLNSWLINFKVVVVCLKSINFTVPIILKLLPLKRFTLDLITNVLGVFLLSYLLLDVSNDVLLPILGLGLVFTLLDSIVRPLYLMLTIELLETITFLGVVLVLSKVLVIQLAVFLFSDFFIQGTLMALFFSVLLFSLKVLCYSFMGYRTL